MQGAWEKSRQSCPETSGIAFCYEIPQEIGNADMLALSLARARNLRKGSLSFSNAVDSYSEFIKANSSLPFHLF
jgi:hypothetical protein